MATQTIPRDLGLDLRKLPDLTDSATRKRLSPAAIEAVLKISEKWGLKSDDAMLTAGRDFQREVLRAEKEPQRSVDTGRTDSSLTPDRNLQSSQHFVQ